MTTLKDQVLAYLQTVAAPGSDRDIVSAGLVRALSATQGKVQFVLDGPEADLPQLYALRNRLEGEVAALDGVEVATVVVTATPEAPPPQDEATPQLPGVGRIVLVGSGKGGVGKSTVTANLALALADRGLRVGLLDADIYGPSQPKLMGTDGRPVSYDGTLIPISVHGIKLLSLGLMLDPDQALVWRGPILANTLHQMLFEVRWAPLDILLIDLPPGTGDVQITLAQEAVLDGAVIVSTPQDVALIDARRAIDLFTRTETPILGMIENMSTHICKSCGAEEPIFGTGGARQEAERLGIPLLGALPLNRTVCDSSEAGTPIVRTAPDSVEAVRFTAIAGAIAESLQLTTSTAE